MYDIFIPLSYVMSAQLEHIRLGRDRQKPIAFATTIIYNNAILGPPQPASGLKVPTSVLQAHTVSTSTTLLQYRHSPRAMKIWTTRAGGEGDSLRSRVSSHAECNFWRCH
jgi:hypothetical protein